MSPNLADSDSWRPLDWRLAGRSRRPGSWSGIVALVSGGEVFSTVHASWIAVTDSSSGTRMPGTRVSPGDAR